jgi:hypothetical protein
MSSVVPCPYITDAAISLTGDGVALFSVTYNGQPEKNQTLLVEYKLSSDSVWTVASTNLKCDPYGNLISTKLNVISSPTAGESYDIRISNQCGGLSFTKTINIPVPVLGNPYLIGYALYNICGNDPVYLFSDSAFDSGAVIYTDFGLTTVLTGYSIICSFDGSEARSIDPVTGVVGALLGSSCVGIETLARYSNSHGTVCAATPEVVYSTSLNPTTGDVLYTDKALSSPLTGYTYVVIDGSLDIYNLNTSTGVIGSLYGSACLGEYDYYQVSKTIADITEQSVTLLYSSSAFGSGAEMKTDSTLSTALTGYNYIRKSSTGETRELSSASGVVGCLAVNC